MMHEVRSIPPAPRRVRLRPLLAHRWPMLLIGGVMFVFGMLISWAMLLQSGGKLSLGPALDRGPTKVVPGRLTRISESRTFDGKQWQFVDYEFTWEVPRDPSAPPSSPASTTVSLNGFCFVPVAPRHVGDAVQVEVLLDDANASRVVGGVLHTDRAWLRARFWIGMMVIPGALILLGWLAGMFQLRHVLVNGDVSVGHVRRITRVPFVLPEMLLVRYEFLDHRAIARSNRHWVRAHGPLGARLSRQVDATEHEPMPVLHDRRLPQWSRMLLPADYLPSTAKDVLSAGGIS